MKPPSESEGVSASLLVTRECGATSVDRELLLAQLVELTAQFEHHLERRHDEDVRHVELLQVRCDERACPVRCFRNGGVGDLLWIDASVDHDDEVTPQRVLERLQNRETRF